MLVEHPWEPDRFEPEGLATCSGFLKALWDPGPAFLVKFTCSPLPHSCTLSPTLCVPQRAWGSLCPVTMLHTAPWGALLSLCASDISLLSSNWTQVTFSALSFLHPQLGWGLLPWLAEHLSVVRTRYCLWQADF